KMWNAGVIGLNSSKKEILKEVLSLTDAVYKQFPKHIAEQFAFSYCFQHAGEVMVADNRIEHYWNLKEFRNLLQVFFMQNSEENIPNLIKLINHIDASAIRDQKIAFEGLPVYRKWVRKLLRRGWSINDYIKKIVQAKHENTTALFKTF